MQLFDHVNEYKQMGAVSLGIVGQKSEAVKRYNDSNGLPLPVLIDPDRSVIKQYGVYHHLGIDAYNIARPSLFLIDKAGIIRFIHVGSSQFDRPGHEVIVQELEKIKNK